MHRPCLLLFSFALTALPVRADEPLAVLARTGKENAVDRLVAIRQLARMHDPLASRALAAAYARLEADPAGGFSEPEKVAALQALATSREPAAGPCACKALSDPARAVRGAGLRVIRELRHPQAAPFLIDLMASTVSAAGEDKSHLEEDLALAQQANDLMEILANASMHYEALSSPAERQVAVTRWKQWWEGHQARPRPAWQQEGFQEEKIPVTVPKDGQETLKAEDVPALLEALAAARPAWIRENAQEALSAIPAPPPGAKLDQHPACAALAKGLDHADEGVRKRAASALFQVLARAGHPGLPETAQDLPGDLKAWWGAHASR